MSFANHNILDIALSIIPPTVVQIRKNLGTEANKYGQVGAAYSEWIEVYGIVQPGSERNEHVEGMDISKKYVSIWLRGIALDGTHIQWAPDQIRYLDRIYNVVGVDDWFPYDNYRKCECVEALNLGAAQKTVKATKTKTSRVKNPKAESPMESQPPQKGDAAPPKEKPTLFVPDGLETKEESLPSEKPPKKPVVHKARIRI